MVLIIGTTDDDILYFKTKMDIVSTDFIGQKHPVYVGSYSGQEVCVTTSSFSNELASVVTGLCIDKYRPYVVLAVGSLHAYDQSLKQGDIILTERVYLGEVNFTPWGDLKYGQICDMPFFFHSEDDYLRLIETLNGKIKNKKLIRGSVLATDKFYTNLEKVTILINRHFASVESMCAVDTEIGGIACACQFFDVPWISLKSVNYVIGHDDQLVNFVRKGLEASPTIGSLISALFIDLRTNS